ncbi:hypothetical protein HDU98_007193 [Podochytrium sp. JEL0797]|nr:hypothetical protein HDU98_007193 [Podochytrium sp. JEL0797]
MSEAGATGNIQIHNTANDEVDEQDEYNLRIQRTGCFPQHNALLDCHYASKDWRKCTSQMAAFRKCFERHDAMRNERSIEDRARESVKVERDEDSVPTQRENPVCELPEGYYSSNK